MIHSNSDKFSDAWADPEGEAGGPNPLENHKCLKVSLEFLVRTPLKKQFLWFQLLFEGDLYGPL